jgi:hypothetical protein
MRNALLLTTAAALWLGAGLLDARAAADGCPDGTTGMATPADKGTAGEEKPAVQPMEKSAILPNATQHEQSAAPTVQQDGQAVVATECPKPPNQPNNVNKQ